MTHSGKVYKYEPGNISFTKAIIDARVDKYSREPYNYTVELAFKRAMEDVQKEYGALWKEIK